MDTDIDKITEIIIGAAYNVANKLGSGFLEKVYENALAIEIQKNKLQVKQQEPITVYYDEIAVGEYIADLIVENSVIVELKAIKELTDIHKAQVINYLKATKLKAGLLINFGKPRIEIKRLSNNPG